MLWKFLKNREGSIGPIAMVCLPILVSIVGLSVDYARVLSHKGHLQSVTDMAVLTAMRNARSDGERASLARDFISVNLPDADFETRNSVVDGKIMFQVRSKLETPIMAMVGKPEFLIDVSTPMRRGSFGSNGRFKPARYSESQLRDMRRRMDRMIANAPPRHRARYRREYEKYYQNLRRNKRRQ